MASYNSIALLAIFLVFQPWTAASNILSPTLSPIFDDVCKHVECGKGTCKPSPNNTWFYVCECHPGWKQTRPQDDDDLKFLPCVIPNCTLNYSCTEAPSPVQEKDKQANTSFFDPCHWADCGGGMCNKTSAFTHTCQCNAGYYNLLNVTAFPCFRDCALGLDCENLGISGSNKSTSSDPSFADDVKNQASSITQGNNWLIIFSMLMAPILWKYSA
ncbi:unnamed protein product [Ilex paraguariensis]|uniref:Uncharacterized protein n=1 Tax=Ilex paraguariensis TaxID=185542 RepID=A0ABC8SUE6_9AQUA